GALLPRSFAPPAREISPQGRRAGCTAPSWYPLTLRPCERAVTYGSGASSARLIDRPVDDRDIEIREVGGVVRDERCPKPPRESSDQQVSVVVRPPVTPPVRPEPRCVHPHGPVVVDPLERASEGGQLFQLPIRPPVV